jgi:hypothetical protein
MMKETTDTARGNIVVNHLRHLLIIEHSRMAPAVFDTQTYRRRLREPRIELRSIRGSRLVRRHPYRQCVSEGPMLG